jgi:hypothetical protein
MVQLENYKEVNYNVFQKALDLEFANSEIKEIEIALKVGVKTTATIKNAFRKDTQIVSDEVLTKIMDVVGLDGFVLWYNGKRLYYIKN